MAQGGLFSKFMDNIVVDVTLDYLLADMADMYFKDFVKTLLYSENSYPLK